MSPTMTKTVFQYISERASQAPDAVAILCRGRRPLSYAALRDHVSFVIAQLNQAGAGRGDRVALVLPKGSEAVTAFLGVSAGATAVPLNPECTIDEYKRLFSVINPKLVMVEEGSESVAIMTADSMQIPILKMVRNTCFDAGLFELCADFDLPAAPQPGLATLDEDALLLQTSGTTSSSKLVPLTHKTLVASAHNIAKSLELNVKDCCLDIVPSFHIGGLVDVVAAPLASGGSVVCSSGFSVSEFFMCLDEFQPTWTQAAPAMLQEILNATETQQYSRERSSLRVVRSVSAPIGVELRDEFERLFRVPVLDIYGLSETSGLVACDSLRGPRKRGAIGPSAGPELGIMDPGGRLLEAKRVGEIVVRGETVMTGYDGDSDFDAAHYFDTWFRTGDMGYLDEDGYLFLTGRLKETINKGGDKISPSEIDGVLLSHPGIDDCATFSLPHETLGEEPAAAVVTKTGVVMARTDVVKYLSERLAAFKVPRNITFVERIPKSATGKVERSRLAEALGLVCGGSRRTPRPKYVPPSTTLGETLARMWSGILKIDPIGIHDNFFDLGGDSLKAARLVNDMETKWDEIIYVSAIFDAPTIAELEVFLVRHYPELAARELGHYIKSTGAVPRSSVDSRKLGDFRKSIVLHLSPKKPPTKMNDRAIFVLSPPRSGSTLLRVMLAGHSRLFSPPELLLLCFENLAQRKSWFPGSQKFLLEGNIRAVMQLMNQGLEAARQWVEELEQVEIRIEDYYRRIQDWATGRMLVDKTPYYAARIETLQRAELLFDQPIYIHLTRHPYGMIRSFEEAKMDQLWYPRLVGADTASRVPCPYDRREFGEMIWLLLHQNIMEFLMHVSPERQFRLRFEDVVSNPHDSMCELCRFMGLEFESEILQPHAHPGERMTDGLHPVSRMIGDMKFHQHKDITAGTADLWKHAYENDFLSDETWTLAKQFGYTETVASARGRREYVV